MKDPVLICSIFNRDRQSLTTMLESWCEQTCQDFTLLLVDDGSTDQCIPECVEASGAVGRLKDLRVLPANTKRDRPRTLQIPPGFNNPAYAFNVGIQQSIAWKFENVFFFSSDIKAKPDLLQLIHAEYLHQLNDLCLHARAWDPQCRAYSPRGDYCCAAVPRPLGWFWGTAIKNVYNARIAEGQYYDEGFLDGFAYEDGDFTGRVALETELVVIDDRLEVMHQTHPSHYAEHPVGRQGCVNNHRHAASKWDGEPQPWDGHIRPIKRHVVEQREGFLKFVPSWP